jgi:hypothetical protein
MNKSSGINYGRMAKEGVGISNSLVKNSKKLGAKGLVRKPLKKIKFL